MTTHRIPGRGRVDHARPVRFTLRRRDHRGPRRRHRRLGAARQRRPPDGPLVQVPPPARHLTAGSEEPNALIGTRRGPGRFEPNTRATQCRRSTRASTPRARTAGRR